MVGMNILFLQAGILGFVQGITEFLPVSSTGHLVIMESLFHFDQARYGLSFDMFTNIGTTLALVWYFRGDLWNLLRSLRLPSAKKPLSLEEKKPWWILGSTIIVGIAGFALEKRIATTFRSLPLIALALILFSFVMLYAEYRAKQQKPSALTVKKAYGVGLAQMLAFIPGISRSGATISTGLVMGLTRVEAARWSFLLSAPITIAAILKRLLTAGQEFTQTGLSTETVMVYLIGAVVAGITGYYSIRFLLKYLQHSTLAAFAYYRIALGVLVLLYVFTR
jgi:undecaprenyl-diphosphatase